MSCVIFFGETGNILAKSKAKKRVIGWREWVALPEFGIERIKAKVDTGARTSSLHAFDLETFQDNGQYFVRFKLKPQQRNSKIVVPCCCPVEEYRKVKSSNGQSETRPVIVTDVVLLGDTLPIEITLTNRDTMGFRMLLGRESIRRSYLVDAGRSYFGEKLKKRTME
jgi:hypothetical protein